MGMIGQLLLWRLTANIAVVFVFFSTILVVTQLLDFLPRLIDAGVGPLLVLRLFVLNLPMVTGILLPFCLLIALVRLFGALIEDGEAVVLLAAGLHPLRILAVPALVCGAVAGGMLVSSVWVEPQLRRDLRDLRDRIVSDAVVLLSAQTSLTRIGAGLYVRSGPMTDEGGISELFVLDQREAGNETLYTARNARFEDDEHGLYLIMQDGQIRAYGPRPADTYSIDFDSFVVAPSFFLPDRERSYPPAEIITSDLWRIWSDKNPAGAPDNAPDAATGGGRPAQAQGELARRYSDWLYAPLFAVVAAWLFLRSFGNGLNRARAGMPRMVATLGLAMMLRMLGFLLLGQAPGNVVAAVATVLVPAGAIVVFALLVLHEARRVRRAPTPAQAPREAWA